MTSGMPDPIAKFVAVIAPGVSPIKVSDEGCGRVTFEVPESELAEFIKLIAYGKDHALVVTVEAQE